MYAAGIKRLFTLLISILQVKHSLMVLHTLSTLRIISQVHSLLPDHPQQEGRSATVVVVVVEVVVIVEVRGLHIDLVSRKPVFEGLRKTQAQTSLRICTV